MSENSEEKITDSTQFEIMRLLQDAVHWRSNMKELHSFKNRDKGSLVVGYRPTFYEKLCQLHGVVEIRVRSDYTKPYKMVVEAWKFSEEVLENIQITLTEAQGQDLIRAIKDELAYLQKRQTEIRSELLEIFESIQSGSNHKRNARKQ